MKRTEPKRTGTEEHRKVADSVRSDLAANRKTLRDTDVHSIGLQLLLGNSARLGGDPGSATNTISPGPDHVPSPHEKESEAAISLPSLAGLTDSKRRTHLIHLLDEVRQRYITARADRIELMAVARDNGVSCRDIGIVLGISEQSVRAQLKRASQGGEQ